MKRSLRPAEAAPCSRVTSEVNEEILASGGSCTMLPGDVSDPDSVRAMFRKMASVCDGPDVLVNNAGRAYFGLLSDMTDDDWRQVIDTDLSSAFYCCREAIPYMVSRKQGRIINISSMWGTAGASCEAAYSAAKSGLHGLTRALAKELAPSNIQVNALACGVIDTEMNSRLDAGERAALEERPKRPHVWFCCWRTRPPISPDRSSVWTAG